MSNTSESPPQLASRPSALGMPPEEIELFLEQTLEKHMAEGTGSTPSNLAEAIRYSVLAPGKRIRPRLLLASAKMLDLDTRMVLPAALAVEMIHCFTLVHDDLPCMDNDDFRRGQPANHKKFGEPLALLTGDALIGLALDAFLEVQQHFAPEAFTAAFRRLSGALGPRGVVGGQAAEHLLTSNSRLEDLNRMHALKTGALFSASILIPKDLASIAEDSAEGLAIESFAAELGLAFQVADDLEDATDKPAPTSILFYLGSKEAASMAKQRLGAAQLGLESVWAAHARPLLQISEEVLRKLP